MKKTETKTVKRHRVPIELTSPHGELCKYTPQRLVRNRETYKGSYIGDCRLIAVSTAGSRAKPSTLATLWYSKGSSVWLDQRFPNARLGPYLVLFESSNGAKWDSIGSTFDTRYMYDYKQIGFPTAEFFQSQDDYVRLFGKELLGILDIKRTYGIFRTDLSLCPKSGAVLEWP